MGLDMYLNARYYVYGKSNTVKIEKIDYDGKVVEKTIRNVKTVSYGVGYWRKANAIHKWFVDNCQDGNDDCKDYYVSEDDLKKLKETCEFVLAFRGTTDEKKVVSENLPPCEGFFFGSTDIDEYYFQDLEETIKIVEKALKEIEENDAEIYYSSSW